MMMPTRIEIFASQPIKCRPKRMMNAPAIVTSNSRFLERNAPTALAVAPIATKTAENPITKEKAEVSSLLLDPSPSLSCSMPMPESIVTYPGTSGKTHGDKNDSKPAKNTQNARTAIDRPSLHQFEYCLRHCRGPHKSEFSHIHKTHARGFWFKPRSFVIAQAPYTRDSRENYLQCLASARRGRLLLQFRMPRVPLRCFFVRQRNRQQLRLAPFRTDELQSNRQSCRSKSAGNGNRGMSGNIGRARHSEQLCANRSFPLAGHANRSVPDPRRCNRRSRRNDHVRMLENRIELSCNCALPVKPAHVIHRPHLRAPLQMSAHVVSVFRRARRKVSLRFMIVGCLGHDHVGDRLNILRQPAKRDFCDARIQDFRERLRRAFHQPAHFGFYALKVVTLRPSDSNSPWTVLAQHPVVWPRQSPRIFPGNHFQNDASVRHAPRQRSGMIECRRERHRSRNAYKAVRRLQPYDAAKRRRHADRPAGIRTNRREAHPGRNRCRRTPARSPGYSVERPGIVHRAVMRILAGNSIRKLVHI